MRFLTSKSKLRARSSWVALLGIVCVALVLMVGVVQVTHSHPSGRPDPHCALCVTAHLAVQVVALIVLNFSSRPIEHVCLELKLELPRRRWFFRLDCRPPPAEPAFA
jgi:hypothetical protein